MSDYNIHAFSSVLSSNTGREKERERSVLEVHLKSQQYFMYQHTQTQRERGSLVIPTSASKVV